MKASLQRLGRSSYPLVVIDGASGDADAVTGIASSLAPFPPTGGGYYPGLRRVIAPADRAAHAYVVRILNAAAPYIARAFGVDGLDLLEASFSIVTAQPDTLLTPQRGAHFDSVDPSTLAVLHYLSGGEGSGTGFFRQRSTGIEIVNAANVQDFIAASERENSAISGYMRGGNAAFEEIGRVDAMPDRLAIYPGCVLHSGLIPENANFSADPRTGRLTANLFVKVWRKPRPAASDPDSPPPTPAARSS